MFSIRSGLAAWLVVLASSALPAAAWASGGVYVANFNSANVSQYAVDPLTGALSPNLPETVAAGFRPIDVAVTPDGRSVYVPRLNGTMAQYDVNPLTGALSSKTPTTVPANGGPSDIVVSPDGRSVYVAENTEGNVSQYTIEPLTGTLSPKTPATVPAEGGPNGIAVSPDGKNAYVANGFGRVDEYTIEPLSGTLSPKAPATVPANCIEPTGVAVSPDGRSVYVTCFEGTVTEFDVEPLTGALSPKTPGSTPAGFGSRGIAVSPDGKSAYVADEGNSTVEQFTIDPVTGELSFKSPANIPAGSHPYDIAVSLDGRSVYVTNQRENSVSQYTVDPLTGALSLKAPATIATGEAPGGIAVGPLPFAAQCPANPPKVNVRWHYSANGSSGSWSGTGGANCGHTITLGPQAMEGDLKISPGTVIKAGYDFTLPGNNSTFTAEFTNGTIVFAAHCVSGVTPAQSTFSVALANQSYSVNNSNWYPSGNQSSSQVYQGEIAAPDLCGGGQLRLDHGGTFSAFMTIH